MIKLLDTKYKNLKVPFQHGYELTEDTMYRLFLCSNAKEAQSALDDCNDSLFCTWYVALQEQPPIFDELFYSDVIFPSRPVDFLLNYNITASNYISFDYKKRYFLIMNGDNVFLMFDVSRTTNMRLTPAMEDEYKQLFMNSGLCVSANKYVFECSFSTHKKKMTFTFSDLYFYDGQSLQSKPFSERYELLQKHFGEFAEKFALPTINEKYLFKHRNHNCYERCDYKLLYQTVAWYMLVGSAPSKTKNKEAEKWRDMAHYVTDMNRNVIGTILYKKTPFGVPSSNEHSTNNLHDINWGPHTKPISFMCYSNVIYVLMYIKNLKLTKKKANAKGLLNFNNDKILTSQDTHPNLT
jgi:hypothetical protein